MLALLIHDYWSFHFLVLEVDIGVVIYLFINLLHVALVPLQFLNLSRSLLEVAVEGGMIGERLILRAASGLW
jgi:hypothetical protein